MLSKNINRYFFPNVRGLQKIASVQLLTLLTAGLSYQKKRISLHFLNHKENYLLILNVQLDVFVTIRLPFSSGLNLQKTMI